MSESSTPVTDRDGLDATRNAMRRDLQRTATSVAVLLGVVLALALTGLFAGIRATHNLERAESAESSSRERLWHSYLAQARAVRLTPEAGRRQTVMSVISNAAAIRTTTALRTEAIASLALTDIQLESPVKPIPQGTVQVEMDAALEHYAYGDNQGNVFVCQLASGDKQHSLSAPELGPGTRMNVRTVAFSPDGQKLAVRYDGGAMVIWDLATEQPLVTSAVNATNAVVAGMSFWPDTDKISYADADAQGQITIYDLSKREKLSTAIRVGARAFRFRPGRMQVAVATDNHVDLLSYPDEQKLQTLEAATRVFSLAWSPDATQLAVSTEDGDVYLWDLERGTQRVLRGHSEPCVRLGFSPDGEIFFSGSRDGTTRLWDMAQGQTLVVANEGLAHIVSSDGKRIGFWRPTVGFGVWKLLRSEAYSMLVCPKADGAFLSLDLSPSGRWCLATQSKGFRIWDLMRDEKETFVPVADLQSVRIMPDETALLVCRRTALELWPFGTNTGGVFTDEHAARRIPLPEEHGPRAVAVSLGGRYAVVELTDSRLLVLDLTSNEPPVFLKETVRLASLRTPASATGAGRFAISPEGRWVATGFGVGREDRPKIWDARTGELVTQLDAPSSVVVFSPEGDRLGTAGIANFGIWSVGDWKLLNKFSRDEPAVTHGSMAFTRGSDQIVITRTRQQAQLRNALGDEKFADLVAPQLQSVNSVRMALDGSVLVTASATDKLQVWRLNNIVQTLATVGLNQPAKPERITNHDAKPAPNPMRITLILTLVGFAVVTVLALLTLRRHRVAISGFLAAETKAAQQSEALTQANLELMHSSKMKSLGTLAAGIAHDFNNLLSVIRMSNKLIGREVPKNEEVREHVETVEQAVQQGKMLVESMLGYSRERADDDEPKDVEGIIEETVALLSKEFLSGIALTLEMDRSLPRARVPAGKVEQVLLNLIVNASEAMKGRGKLKISAHQRTAMIGTGAVLQPRGNGSVIEIAVADSGPGIAPELRARIFEPFFTTKNAGNRRGTGLGLSMVYNIAEQQGFGLAVDGSPGQGATFRLLIPAVP